MPDTSIWHGANAYLDKRRVRHTFSHMTRFNLPSRRAHARLGAKCAARAVFVQAWRLEMRLASIFPYVALTWGASQRPCVRLAPDALGALAASPLDEAAVRRSA